MWTTAGGLLLGTRTHTRTGAMGRGVSGITSPSDFSTIKGAHCGLEDVDSHTVRATMTLGFLDLSKSHGNDFSTPVP